MTREQPDPRRVSARLLAALGVSRTDLRRVVIVIEPHAYPTVDVHRLTVGELEIADHRTTRELVTELERFTLHPMNEEP
jgi:hypothetical protein